MSIAELRCAEATASSWPALELLRQDCSRAFLRRDVFLAVKGLRRRCLLVIDQVEEELASFHAGLIPLTCQMLHAFWPTPKGSCYAVLPYMRLPCLLGHQSLGDKSPPILISDWPCTVA